MSASSTAASASSPSSSASSASSSSSSAVDTKAARAAAKRQVQARIFSHIFSFLPLSDFIGAAASASSSSSIPFALSGGVARVSKLWSTIASQHTSWPSAEDHTFTWLARLPHSYRGVSYPRTIDEALLIRHERSRTRVVAGVKFSCVSEKKLENNCVMKNLIDLRIMSDWHHVEADLLPRKMSEDAIQAEYASHERAVNETIASLPHMTALQLPYTLRTNMLALEELLTNTLAPRLHLLDLQPYGTLIPLTHLPLGRLIHLRVLVIHDFVPYAELLLLHQLTHFILDIGRGDYRTVANTRFMKVIRYLSTQHQLRVVSLVAGVRNIHGLCNTREEDPIQPIEGTGAMIPAGTEQNYSIPSEISSHIDAIAHLTSFTLLENKLREEELLWITRITTIRHLSLECVPCLLEKRPVKEEPRTIVERIPDLPVFLSSLQSLNLVFYDEYAKLGTMSSTSEPLDWSILRNCSELRNLSMRWNDWNEKKWLHRYQIDVGHFISAQESKLESLTIGYGLLLPPSSIASLSQCTNLTRLHLMYHPIESADMANIVTVLGGLSKFSVLELTEAQLEEEDDEKEKEKKQKAAAKSGKSSASSSSYPPSDPSLPPSPISFHLTPAILRHMNHSSTWRTVRIHLPHTSLAAIYESAWHQTQYEVLNEAAQQLSGEMRKRFRMECIDQEGEMEVYMLD